jgi:hypothetical protein
MGLSYGYGPAVDKRDAITRIRTALDHTDSSDVWMFF